MSLVLATAGATRGRAQRNSRTQRNAFVVEPMEARVCLASLSLPFLAPNFSYEDPGFEQQSANLENRRTVELVSPAGFDVGNFVYNREGRASASFTWTEPKQVTRNHPVAGIVFGGAFAQGGVTVSVGGLESAETLDEAMAVVEQEYPAPFMKTFGASMAVPWTVRGGGLNGRTVSIEARAARFRAPNVAEAAVAMESMSLELLIPWGMNPSQHAIFVRVHVTFDSTITTSDPEVLPLTQVATETMGVPSLPEYHNLVLTQVGGHPTFHGAIPELLMLYDFSSHDTVTPAALDYVNQYDQADLPEREKVPGGNACGPSALVMALQEVVSTVEVQNAFDNTMTTGKPDPRHPGEMEQEFYWPDGEKYARGKLPGSHSVVVKEYDTWPDIDANLNAGSPVLVSTELSTGTGLGTGHVLLLLGVGKDPTVKAAINQVYGNGGDYYVVSDPAGHYFGDATAGGHNRGHYGKVLELRKQNKGINYGGWFAVYPKAQLRDKVERPDAKDQNKTVIRTMTIKPVQPVIKTGAHSPVSIVITDPLGRRSGIRPDGSILDEIPDGDYQVAVGEEFGGAITYYPEEEKGVVITRPVHGTYQVELVGTGTGSYTLDVDILQPGAALATTTHAGSVVPGEVKRYSFTFPPGNSPAPRVTDVFVRSSAWSPAFRSALAAAGLGDAGAGYKMPAGGAAQSATVPWTEINQVVLRFDRAVDVGAADVAVRGVRRNYVAVAVVPLAGLSNAYVVTLDAPLGADKLRIDVDGDVGGVTAAAGGQLLDGNADGVPGGDWTLPLAALGGDVTRDGAVDAADALQVRARQRARLAAPAAYPLFHDLDGSGAINVIDLALVRRRAGDDLPGSAPGPSTSSLLPLSAPARRARPAPMRLSYELLA